MRRFRKVLSIPLVWSYRLAHRVGVLLFISACWMQGGQGPEPQPEHCKCENGPMPIWSSHDSCDYCEECGLKAYPF